MDIFVAKLNSETTAENLTELFSQYGIVASSKVIMDRETGKSKCFGFVEMEDEMEGAAAVEHLNEFNFMGFNIVVKKSEPRAQEKPAFKRKPSFGGGGGGGRRDDGNRKFGNHNREGGGERREFGERRDFNKDRSRGYNR